MTEPEIEARRGWYLSVVAGEKERIRTYSELAERIAYLFADDAQLVYEESAAKTARKHEGRAAILGGFLDWLRPRIAAGVDPAALREEGKRWMEQKGIRTPQLF